VCDYLLPRVVWLGWVIGVQVTYNECVFALDGHISDLSILAEGLLEVLGACAPAETSHVNLGILR